MRLTAQQMARLGSSNRQSKIRNRKSAFTLVELLVSMALIIFTMSIMTYAFSKGMEAFRRLKAVGDMQQAVRTAVNALRQDLGSAHFDGDRRLSKLGVNPRINPGEIPPVPPSNPPLPPHGTPYNPLQPVNAFTIYDTDGDGEITFADLNYQEVGVASPNVGFFGGYINQGPNKILDNNQNGPFNATTGQRHFIDPGDLLYLRAGGGWANGVDDDPRPILSRPPGPGNLPGNGVVDDLFLSSSPNGWFCPELGFFTYGEGYWNRFQSADQWEFAGNPNAIPYGPVLVEGLDGSNLPAFRDLNDFLHFTVRLSGNGPQDFYYGKVPAGSPLDVAGMPLTRHDLPGDGRYASQWVEVVYFLLPDFEEVDPVTSIPLRDPATNDIRIRTTGNYNQLAGGGFYRIVRYHLYRRVLLLVPEAFTTPGQLTGVTRTVTINAPNLDAALQQYYSQFDISAAVTQTGGNTFVFEFNSPADVQLPQRRFRVFWNTPPYGTFAYHWDQYTSHGLTSPPQRMSLQQQTPEAGLRWGAELLLKNVLSFDVKVWDPSAVPVNAAGAPLPGPMGDFCDLGYNFWTPPTGPVSALCQPGNTSLLRPAILGQDIRVSNGARNLNPVVPGSQFGGAGFNGFTQTGVNGNSTYPYTPRGFGNPIAPEKFIYDTWTARNAGPGTGANAEAQNLLNYTDNSAHRWIPYPYPIRALQIKIRVWDERTKQTRETTFVQNM